MLDRFTDRTVLITGGGSGIGQATVARLLAEGATVVAADVSAAGLDETTQRAVEDGTVDRLTTTMLDISDEDAVGTVVPAAIAQLGGLDVLVNAAGMLRGAHTHDCSLDLWNRIIAVNLTGTFAAGAKFRVRAEYVYGNSGDTVNATTYGAWKYFTFTR